MNAQTLLHDLIARGVALSANGDQLDVDGPDNVLTDELLTTLKERKQELLKLLRPRTPKRPNIGSFARPRMVRGSRMPTDCLWATCDGSLIAQAHNRYMCSNCKTWFELLTPLDLGDLGDASVITD